MQLRKSPLVSVIIPVYNGEDCIGACLESVLSSDFRDFEIVVVDDGSTDRTTEIVRRYSCVLLQQENAGPGAARNLGVMESSGEYLFFLDADVVVPWDAIGRLVKRFRNSPEVGAFFGSYGIETGPDNFVSVYKNLLHHYTHQTANARAATFCGGFGAMRREVFDASGGFLPQQRFLEDVELGYRMHQLGVEIRLEKDWQFTHLKRYSLWGLIRSDVVGRAIPWTRLLLGLKLFKNDLNTRTHNVVSVPLSWMLLLAVLVAPAAGAWVLAVAGALLAALAVLNWRFLHYVGELEGGWFAARSLGMLWLGYLYSAVGAGIGVCLHLSSPMAAEELVEDVDLAGRS